MEIFRWLCMILFAFSLLELHVKACDDYQSAVGDPGMQRDGLRVAIESWNQCNEVGQEAPFVGSPRMADCFDIDNSTNPVQLFHKVDEKDNRLGLLNGSYGSLQAPSYFDSTSYDKYAVNKEIYLGDKCQVNDTPVPWQFWMIMIKSGNMDTMAAKCPENGKKSTPFAPTSRFPCFGEGCMNMPLMYHNYTSLQQKFSKTLRGSFYGTWDLGAGKDVIKGVIGDDVSYFNVTWEKEVGKGSWAFHHTIKTSTKYPWLMLYLRSDPTAGFSGGYHYQTRGMSKIIPKTPDFTVKFRLEVKKGGGPKTQFYLMDIGSCWKNNGKPCDGDVTTDVTRYSEMIINPDIQPWCTPDNVKMCPPYHTLSNGKRIHRTDKKNFPYGAYHLHCSPGNAEHLEEPYDLCDPYSNPQAQEIVQILPHPAWDEYGYPTKKGEGWIGDPRNWELDVGRLSQALYFYQDPGTEPVERYWPSINIGTEIYVSSGEVAEWSVSDFDILVDKDE